MLVKSRLSRLQRIRLIIQHVHLSSYKSFLFPVIHEISFVAVPANNKNLHTKSYTKQHILFYASASDVTKEYTKLIRFGNTYPDCFLPGRDSIGARQPVDIKYAQKRITIKSRMFISIPCSFFLIQKIQSTFCASICNISSRVILPQRSIE